MVVSTEQPPPLPPSTPPPPPPRTGFHGPATNLFRKIRNHLSALEQQGTLQLKRKQAFKWTLIIGFIIGASFALILSSSIEGQTGLGITDPLLVVIVAPITEEMLKGLSILIIAILAQHTGIFARTIPNRKVAAALGATVGLGFGVFESLFYIGRFLTSGADAGQITFAVIIRIIVTPMMHPLWSAFAGIGIFVLPAKNPADRRTPLLLAPLFPLFGLLDHMIWNGLSYATVFPDVFVTFPLFAVILRDFLGGHFNFQKFFESPPEEDTSESGILPSPPPPPSIQGQY